MRHKLFYYSLITIKEDLVKLTRPQLLIQFQLLQERHRKLRLQALKWVAENLREIKEWSQDPWLESLVLDVQIQLAAAQRAQHPGEDHEMADEEQIQQDDGYGVMLGRLMEAQSQARRTRLAEHRHTLVGIPNFVVIWNGDEEEGAVLAHGAREMLVQALLGTQPWEQEEYLQDAKKIPAMLEDMNDELTAKTDAFAKDRREEVEKVKKREKKVKKMKAQGAAEREERV